MRDLFAWSRGLSLGPGWVNVWCSWAKHFIFTVPLNTQEYKWVLANYKCQESLMRFWGSNPAMNLNWQLIQVVIRFMLREPG